VRVLGPNHFVFEGLNPAHERATGLRSEDLAGRRPQDALDPVTAARVLARYKQCAREGRTITYFENLNLPSGITDWETTLTPVVDDSGRVVRIIGHGRALVRHPIAEEEVSPSQRELRRALDLSPNRVAILDRAGEIVYVNRAWRQFAEQSGFSGGGIGMNYLSVSTGGDPDSPTFAKLRHGLKRLLDGQITTFAHPYAAANHHFVLRATRIVLEGAVFVMASHQDITEIVKTQRELAHTTERLLAIQEEERARIAHELHDSTSQHLVAIGLGLASLRRGRVTDAVIEDMRRSLAEAHKEIRTLTYLLHPPKLEQNGLTATLRGFVEGYRRRSGLSIVTTLYGPLDELPFELQKTVFRIVQEALANTHRHAAATRVSVEISLKTKGLHVSIVDDGKAQQTAMINGVGIEGMEARVHQFEGVLTVRRRSFGMVVQAFIPRTGFSRLRPPGAANSA
jgi:signal transduction histidine kinase